MRNAALFGFIGAGSLMTLTGCEPVDDGAATRAKGWDGVLTDNVLPGDRQVFTDTDETMKVADGCAKTELDAMAILDSQCASCHDAASPAQVPTTFDFVTDVAKMKSSMWTPSGGTAMRYLTVGDANHSAIFVRVGVQRDMPPIQSGLDQPFLERVTLSGVSVLRQWIDVCL